ncbi:hypothetical protein, partial [Rothia sp. HMSC065C03]
STGLEAFTAYLSLFLLFGIFKLSISLAMPVRVAPRPPSAAPAGVSNAVISVTFMRMYLSLLSYRYPDSRCDCRAWVLKLFSSTPRI